MTKRLCMALFVAVAAATASQAQALTGNAEAGAGKIAMCIGCHGIEGYQASFPEVHKVPKIGGQGAGYIVAALKAYQKGERRHPSMRGIAASLSAQDMADIAAYYAKQGRDATPAARAPAPPEVAALLQKGGCVACHGSNFATPIDPAYPKIAGQYPDYLFVALKAYQTEANPEVGRANPVMGSVARQFSHAELRLLAGYVGSLQGELRTVPQPRFR